MSIRIPFKTGDEHDALGFRKYHKFKAGVVKKIKRQYNKRLRRFLKRGVYYV